MPTSPSIAPHGAEQDTYIVLDEIGPIGRAWRTDRQRVVGDLLSGEFSNPVRVVAFNTFEGWSRDVTVDIADEMRRRIVEYDVISNSVNQFVEANRR
jgi:hypothetical protein